MMILTVTSIILICVEKQNQRDIDFLTAGTYLVVLLASVLHLYPYLMRASIHVIPILIFLVLKPIDVLNMKRLLFYVFVIFTINGFYGYFSPDFIKNAYNISDKYISYSPDELMKIIKREFNDKKDEIIVNSASTFSFIYYVRKNDFLIAERHLYSPDVDKKNVKKSIYKYLNNLSSNKNYWFYLIKEYREMDRYYIQEWLKHQNIKYYKKDRNSYLCYVVPPYKRVEP